MLRFLNHLQIRPLKVTTSVSDPFHFETDPDPRICFVENEPDPDPAPDPTLNEENTNFFFTFFSIKIYFSRKMISFVIYEVNIYVIGWFEEIFHDFSWFFATRTRNTGNNAIQINGGRAKDGQKDRKTDRQTDGQSLV